MAKFLQRLIDNQWRCFLIFGVSAAVFLLGVGTIFWADTLTPSLRQEMYALAGMLIAGIGFITAIAMQVCLIIARLFRKY